MDNWFVLEDIAMHEGKSFSVFMNINDIDVQYDLLDMKFRLVCIPRWFTYHWRRRDDEQISCLFSKIGLNIKPDDMYNIPLFKKVL